MKLDALRQLCEVGLADYVECRLRRQGTLDPPLATRFGEEPPEQFLVQAVRLAEDEEFRRRLIRAVHEVLRRWTAAANRPVWRSRRRDEALGGLARLAAEVGAVEIVADLHNLAAAWADPARRARWRFTHGQTECLRTLALLQSGPSLASFWHALWQDGPRSARGTVFVGWARANSIAALRHLDALVQWERRIDVPDALSDLLAPGGPSVADIVRAASRLSEKKRGKLHKALRLAGIGREELSTADDPGQATARQAPETPAAVVGNVRSDCHPRAAARGQAAPVLERHLSMIPPEQWLDVDCSSDCPQVFDQQSTQMSAAMAVVAAMQALLCRRDPAHPVSLSPANLYARINAGIDAGSLLSAALYEAKTRGVCTAALVPLLDWQHGLPPGWEQEASRFRINEYLDCHDLAAIATAVQKKEFVVSGISIDRNFMPDANGVVPAPSASPWGRHAVLITGMKKIGDAWHFQIQNSWGRNWGQQGFAYVPESYWHGESPTDAWCIRSVTLG
jgi:hypothetical protein